MTFLNFNHTALNLLDCIELYWIFMFFRVIIIFRKTSQWRCLDVSSIQLISFSDYNWHLKTTTVKFKTIPSGSTGELFIRGLRLHTCRFLRTQEQGSWGHPGVSLTQNDGAAQLQQPAAAAAVGAEEGGPLLRLHHPGGRDPPPCSQAAAGCLQHALQVPAAAL